MNQEKTEIVKPLAGYHGLRQPSVPLSLTLLCPPLVNLTALDEWLEKVFEVRVAVPPDSAGKWDKSSHAAVAALAWRAMHLGSALLQAAKVPAFDMGRILEINAQKGRPQVWNLRIAVPSNDQVPEKYLRLAYESAAIAVAWMMAKPRTPENAEHIYVRLQQGCVDAFRELNPGGESTIPLLWAAWSLNIPFRHHGRGSYHLGWGHKSVLVDRGAVQFDSGIGAKLAGDKCVSANLLRAAGLPAPVHVQVSSVEQALSVARTMGWPVVIKPVDRDRGEGVTVAISSETALASAFEKARSFSRNIIVEREVVGVCHRILVSRDKVIFVTKRLPKSVKGDGRQSVEQLVFEANRKEEAKPPWLRLKPFPLDALAIECLAAVNLTPQSIPQPGELAPLRRIQSSESGGVVEEMTEVIHPDNVSVAVRAARVFGICLAGIDIISTDIRRPWHENGAIVNEVNYSSLLPGRRSPLLPLLLEQYVIGDGRVPVEAVLGGASAFECASQVQAKYAERGIKCHVTSHETTLSPGGEEIPFGELGLYERSLALTRDLQVEAIIMVIEGDELLRTGLPVDRIDGISVAGESASAWTVAMLQLLRRYERPSQAQLTAPQSTAH